MVLEIWYKKNIDKEPRIRWWKLTVVNVKVFTKKPNETSVERGIINKML